MSVIKSNDAQRIDYSDYLGCFTANHDGSDLQFARVAAVLASTLTMADVLNEVTERFVFSLRQELEAVLPFELDSERFVSLRTLLPLKHASGNAASNPPMLIMGGTDTAIKFY